MASSKFATGTRISSAPALFAAIIFCLIPPTGPTEPSISIVPVANFEEAKQFETDKTAIVAVDSFDEALAVISQYSSR